MRVVKLLATTLALLIMLAGCGQKGPLYRDHQSVSAPAVVIPANTLSDSDKAENKNDADK